MGIESQNKETGIKALGCVTLILVFIAICGFLMMFGGCQQAKRRISKVAVKSCATEKWDTVQVTHRFDLQIVVYKTAVPILTECYDCGPLLLNICEFKIIESKWKKQQ